MENKTSTAQDEYSNSTDEEEEEGELVESTKQVLKCRVRLCKEKHASHFCRVCKQSDVSHFSSQCRTKTIPQQSKTIPLQSKQATGEEEDEEEEEEGAVEADSSKSSNTKKRQNPADIDGTTEEPSTSKKKKTAHKTVSKTKAGKEIKAVSTGPLNSLMLAKKYEEDDFAAVKGWLMSEKLDGVRCYWNGKQMYSRNGNPFYPPDWFKDLLPTNLALDGELWTKRDDFQATLSIVKCQDKNARDWTQITYMVYDAPLLKEDFAERLDIIGEVLHEERSDVEQAHVKLHKHEACTSEEQLDTTMEGVLALNGEGLMLKDPQCGYEKKRSAKLLKVKKFDDAEAVVIAHVQGNGRCSNMLGALRVKDTNGKIFKVGSGFDDKQRKRPPKIGSTITFKHQGVSKNGIPRFPIFLRVHPGM